MKWCISYKVCDAPASFHVAECVAKVFPGSERVPADDAHDGSPVSLAVVLFSRDYRVDFPLSAQRETILVMLSQSVRRAAEHILWRYREGNTRLFVIDPALRAEEQLIADLESDEMAIGDTHAWIAFVEKVGVTGRPPLPPPPTPPPPLSLSLPSSPPSSLLATARISSSENNFIGQRSLFEALNCSKAFDLTTLTEAPMGIWPQGVKVDANVRGRGCAPAVARRGL